jgi:hypothetical protein
VNVSVNSGALSDDVTVNTKPSEPNVSH